MLSPSNSLKGLAGCTFYVRSTINMPDHDYNAHFSPIGQNATVGQFVRDKGVGIQAE
jgi:hypothetical protein